MKIKKFNESVNDKWTDYKLRKFVKDHEYLTGVLQRYLQLKTDEDREGNDHELYNFLFDKDQFMIKYMDVDDFTGYDYYRPDNNDVINFINSKNKYKKWSINTLYNHCDEHMYLIDTIEDYLRWKIEDYRDDNYCEDISFFFYPNRFMINFTDNESDSNTYRVDDYDEMLEFLNDPDLFLDPIKYNL